MYSDLIDESKNKGKREELALAVRYYSGKVVERFIEIKHLSEFDAQTIAVYMKDLIELVTCSIQMDLLSLVEEQMVRVESMPVLVRF